MIRPKTEHILPYLSSNLRNQLMHTMERVAKEVTGNSLSVLDLMRKESFVVYSKFGGEYLATQPQEIIL